VAGPREINAVNGISEGKVADHLLRAETDKLLGTQGQVLRRGLGRNDVVNTPT